MGPQPPGCLGGGRRALRPHLLPSVISDEVRYVNPSRRVSGAPPRITARGGRRLLGTRPSARPARTAARPLAARHRELPRRAAGRLRSPSSVLRLGTGEKACRQRAGRLPGLLSQTGKGRRSCSLQPWGCRSAFAPALRTRCRWKITCPISLRRVAQGLHDPVILSPTTVEPGVRWRAAGPVAVGAPEGSLPTCFGASTSGFPDRSRGDESNTVFRRLLQG